jgi:hypothetical protein
MPNQIAVGGILGAAATVAVLAGVVAPANALPVTFNSGDIGHSAQIAFDGKIGGVGVPGLSAFATVTLASVTNGGKTYSLTIDFENKSDGSIWKEARAAVFGFATDPDVKSVSVNGLFNKASFGNINPAGFTATELCFKNGGGNGNCSGGGGSGVKVGEADSFDVSLTFAGPTSVLRLDGFGIKWEKLRTVDKVSNFPNPPGPQKDGSGHGTGTLVEPAPVLVVDVAEPFSLGLIGTGLATLGVVLRRRRILQL